MTTRSGVYASVWGRLARAAVRELTHPDAAERLRLSPSEAVKTIFGLDVVPMQPHDSSDCSVAGRYYAERRLVVIDTSVVVQRQNFTVLHELGHHLAYEIDDVADQLESFDDPQRAAAGEEDFADAFAAALLLPDDFVDTIIDAGGPRADDAVRLCEEAETASREACAVAAVQRVPRSGYVIIAEPDGTVRFAARSNTPYRIARNTTQPGDSILVRAGESGRASSERATLRYPNGDFTDPHHAQAVRHGDYVFGVFTTGRPPWSDIWIPSEEPARVQEVTCTFAPCGNEWVAVGRPHPACGDHRCPECGRCGCDAAGMADEAVCRGPCRMLTLVGRLIDGVCNDCR